MGGCSFQGVDLSAHSSKRVPIHWTCNKSARCRKSTWQHQKLCPSIPATLGLLAIRSTNKKSLWDWVGNPSNKHCKICPVASTPFCITWVGIKRSCEDLFHLLQNKQSEGENAWRGTRWWGESGFSPSSNCWRSITRARSMGPIVPWNPLDLFHTVLACRVDVQT